MFETPMLAAILIVPLLVAVLFPFLKRRTSKSPTLNHVLLASGSLRCGKQD